MKKIFSFCVICLLGISAMAQAEYVDLGLPSGTLWKSTNESGYFTYDEAIGTYGHRIPKKFHWVELTEVCQWIWIKDYGYKVVGPNGNSIILPASGYRSSEGKISDVGNYCDYWSSDSYDSESAWCLFFYSDKVKMFAGLLSGGRSVRVVKSK
mgnify:CR=1 FL=1